MPNSEFITSSQAAHILGISVSTFYRFEKAGHISPTLSTGYKKLYTKNDVVEMAKRFVAEDEERQKEIARKRAQNSYLYKQHLEANGTNGANAVNGARKNSFAIKTLTLPKLPKLPKLIPTLNIRRGLAALRSAGSNLKPRYKLAPFALGILLILIPVAYLVTKHAKDAQAWYDDSWNYRVKYTVTNSGATVTNQKIKIDIDTAALITDGKLQPNCADSGFTDINGGVLKYFIDEVNGACNTISSDYWILIPTIHSGTTVIYHYYGNPSASAGTENTQFSQTTFSPVSIRLFFRRDRSGSHCLLEV
jgi:hypothetical protein